jgi:Rrf2 family iron-sulfur cluster assembly transcriptional regulator
LITPLLETPLAAAELEASPAGAPDMTKELWNALHTTLMTHMQTISLRSLAGEQRAKGFQVQERKVKAKGVLPKPKLEPLRTTAPNSVFALAQSMRLAT